MRTLIHTLFFFLLFIKILFAQWHQQNSGGFVGDIEAISFFNSSKGFAVSGPYILSTTNGGESWGSDPFWGTYHPALFFLDENNGWKVNYDGTFRYWNVSFTTNSGNTWSSGMAVYDQYSYPKSIFFITPDIGWVVGPRPYGGAVYKSTNGGSSWYPLTSNANNTLNSIFFIDSLNGWAVGEHTTNTPYPIPGSSIIKTTDGGSNWIAQPELTTHNHQSVFFVNINTGWICGDNGMLFKTTNAGSTWQFQETGIDTNEVNCFNEICFVNENCGYIIGKSGLILNTTNSGESWNNQERGTTNDLLSIFFLDSLFGWISGEGGFILRTTNGGVTFIDNEPNQPTDFILEQNFPNPFNPSTVISYQLPVGGNATIKVYDILGNEIATLVDEYKPAGRYEVEFKAEKLSTGFYFYQLKAGDFFQTRSMILLK